MANAKRSFSAQLDQALEVMMHDPNAPLPKLDARLSTLLRIAADLRDLPQQEFKERLKADLRHRAQPHQLVPYLQVHGAARLLTFLQQAFGAQELLREALPDGRVVHAEVRIGDAQISLADATAEYPPTQAALHLYVEDADRAYEQALRAGATSTQQPTDQPYGDREAGVKDAFGNNWYIATHVGGAPHARRHVPEGLSSVTPYLHPRGAQDMIDFLKATFGAEEAFCHRAPSGQIEHAKIRIGDSILEMGEAHGPYQPTPSAIHIHVPDIDRTYQRALEAGATTLFEPVDRDYGERIAGVTDRFGTIWYIATPRKD